MPAIWAGPVWIGGRALQNETVLASGDQCANSEFVVLGPDEQPRDNAFELGPHTDMTTHSRVAVVPVVTTSAKTPNGGAKRSREVTGVDRQEHDSVRHLGHPRSNGYEKLTQTKHQGYCCAPHQMERAELVTPNHSFSSKSLTSAFLW